MKKLRILLIVIGGLGFSACSTTKHIIAHVDLDLESPCVFEKFSELEKDTMSEEVGKKIYRNQQSCVIHQKANYDKLQVHNRLHQN